MIKPLLIVFIAALVVFAYSCDVQTKGCTKTERVYSSDPTYFNQTNYISHGYEIEKGYYIVKCISWSSKCLFFD